RLVGASAVPAELRYEPSGPPPLPVASVFRKRVCTIMVATLAWTMLVNDARCENEEVMVFSEGIRSCGDYLQAAEAELKAKPVRSEPNGVYSTDYLNFVIYADGYLTGVNVTVRVNGMMALSTAGSSTHLSERMAWLEQYCRKHPLDTYINALI